MSGHTHTHKVGWSEGLFAMSLTGLVGLSFVYGDFAPLIKALPWPHGWTYGLGAALVAACAGLFRRRTMAVSTITIAVCMLAWAGTCIAPIVQDPFSLGSWYGISEAMSMLVGVGTLYALRRRRERSAATATLTVDHALRLGRILFGAACLVYGTAHFAYAAYSLLFVPTWLPARMPLMYFTGACQVAAGVGLILNVLPRLAATLEAVMIMLFGFLVWLPSFLAEPRPKWAGSPQNQLSETFLNFLLAAVAWMIADSLRSRFPKINEPKGLH